MRIVGLENPRELESRLALQAQRGDRAALERLWGLYRPRIVRMCEIMVAPASDAADLAQDVFVKVCDGIRTYDPDRLFRVWLFATARNVVIDHLRRRGKGWDIERARSVPGRGESPSDPVLRAESAERVREAVRRLPEPYRLVILYTAWGDCQPSDIAELLQVPPGRVRVHLFRALKMLQEELEAP